MSLRTYFYVTPSPCAVTPSLLFLSPRGVSRGGPSALACLGKTRWEMSPRASFFCRPERSEGSLGTCMPREDKVGNVAPSLLFLSPRGVSRGGPSALACLGKTSRSAVPNEVRDASLSLGRPEKGTFLNSPKLPFLHLDCYNKA